MFDNPVDYVHSTPYNINYLPTYIFLTISILFSCSTSISLPVEYVTSMTPGTSVLFYYLMGTKLSLPHNILMHIVHVLSYFIYMTDK